MRAAVVKNGVVVNVIVVSDPSFTLEDPELQVVVSDEARKGDQYIDGQFVPVEEQ